MSRGSKQASAILASLSPRAIAAAVARCAREDLLVMRIALVYAALQLTLIGWDQPSAIGWENDGVAPKDFMRGVYYNLSWGHAHRYPLFHNLLLLLLCVPILLGFAVAGTWSIDAVVRRVTSVASMTALSLAIKLVHVAMGAFVVFIVARIARRLFGALAGRFAALCAVSCLSITYYGRVSNLDGPYVFWTVLALDRLLDVLERGSPKDYALCALCAAASVATKDQAYASYVLTLPIYLGLVALVAPSRLAAGREHWKRLWLGFCWGAIGYAVFAGVVVNPPGFVARVQMLLGPNSENWRTYTRSAQGLWLNLRDLAAAQAQFLWHAGVVALCWGGVVLAIVVMPDTAGTSRLLRLLPITAGLSSVLAFTLPVARCEHRFMLPLATVLCIYGGAALAFLFRQRVTLLVAWAACAALCLSAVQCVLLDLTQWGDARREVEHYLSHLPRGSVVETYGFVVLQPRFDTSADSPYRVVRVGTDDPSTRAHLAGTTELRDAYGNAASRNPDVIIVADGFSKRLLPHPLRAFEIVPKEWLASQSDSDAVRYFQAIEHDSLPGYRRVLAAHTHLPGFVRKLGGTPIRIHDSTGGELLVLARMTKAAVEK